MGSAVSLQCQDTCLIPSLAQEKKRKEEEENMESVVIKVTVPRYVKKEVNDENISDM